MNITNELVTDYLTGFYKPVNIILKQLREEGEENNIPIILKETENYLNFLLSLYKPHKILEIGTAIGYSSIYFASVCKDAEVYTIEKYENMHEQAKKNIENAGLSNRIRPILGDGEEGINQLKAQGIDDIDFVFIDAAKSHYKRFFNAATSICKDKAIIVSDNILQKAMTASNIYDINRRHRTSVKYMREYLEYICNNPKLTTSLTSIGDGLALTIYTR